MSACRFADNLRARGYVLDDQGDNWTTVAEHLPPIYCVRFGG